VGLAIELCEGCAISWDGRHVLHCTSVPHDIPEDDGLYSLFFSLSEGAEQADGRSCEMLDAERHRADVGQPRPFRVGDRVWARWYPCGFSSRWRRARGQVAAVSGAGCVRIAWTGEGRSTEVLAHHQGCLLVHAGLVGNPLPPNLGDSLVGVRVRVFWAWEDRLYGGVVRAFDGRTGQHVVAYDDGDVVEGTLGELAGDFPYYFFE